MKRIFINATLILTAACNTPAEQPPAKSDTVVITNDTIPELRSTVRNKPVASLHIPVKDELNNWQFAVDAYETRKRFRFRLNMQYKELHITDSLDIPNFGAEPTLVLKKGTEPYSCIIGFLDRKGEFKEYKKASVTNDRFRFTTLKHYYVGSYKTPRKSG